MSDNFTTELADGYLDITVSRVYLYGGRVAVLRGPEVGVVRCPSSGHWQELEPRGGRGVVMVRVEQPGGEVLVGSVGAAGQCHLVTSSVPQLGVLPVS